MMSFYKAELPTEPDGWEESTIREGLGGPDEHSDRFWRKGPYGIEQDSDGGFEAYVLVADTPFKVGDGFTSFEEAVNHLTSQMQEKKVDGGDEDPEEVSEEAAEDAESEGVEKSLDGEIALGPEANSVGKSEDFEKAWSNNPAGTDTEEINDAIDENLWEVGDRAVDAALKQEPGPASMNRAIQSFMSENTPANEDELINHTIDFMQKYDRHPTTEYPIHFEDGKIVWDRPVHYLEDVDAKAIFGHDPIENIPSEIRKSLDGADDSEGTHKKVTPPHPEDVNERHYIDNHALGSARLMSDSPSLEAFERSVGGFRELMASKNPTWSSMYCDPGETVPFAKADESTTYEELEAFERAIHSSRVIEGAFTGKNRIGGTETNPNRGPSKKLAQDRHARENRKGTVVGKGEVGRDLYDRKGWGARRGPTAKEDYRAWKNGATVSESEGENVTRGAEAQSHWDKGEERYRDPEKQKEHADRLLGRGKWDHSYDKDKTGYGRKTPNQKKGTKPNQKGGSVKKSDDESFEKAPGKQFKTPLMEYDSTNPFKDESRTNPGVVGQRPDTDPGMTMKEFASENTGRDETFVGEEDGRPLEEREDQYKDLYNRTMKRPERVEFETPLPDNPRNSGGTIDMREHRLPKRVDELAKQVMDLNMRVHPDLDADAYNNMYRDAYESAQKLVMEDAIVDRIWDNYKREGWTPEDEDQAYRELLDDPYRVGTGMVGPQMMESIYNDVGRSVYGHPDAEGNDPLTPYRQVYVDKGEQYWTSPAERRRAAAIRPAEQQASADEMKAKAREDAARRAELDAQNQEKKEYLDNLKAGKPGEKALESAQDRSLGLQAKKQNEDAYRQQMEAKMTPKQPEQPAQPKKRKERWSKERKDAARAEREVQNKPEQEASSETASDDKPETEPTQKSWDARLAETSFRDMLSFERSKRDSKKGIAVGTMAELKGAEMQGSHPIKELYRTVQMGEDKDWNLSSPYDPKVHKTDSESKKL